MNPENKRILIVEDDLEISEMLEMAISIIDSTSTTERIDTSSQAKNRIGDKTKPPPDLILVDIKLGGSSEGLVLIEEARRGGFINPMIVMTARYEYNLEAINDSLRVKGLLGIQGFISKPFDIDTLETTLHNAWQSSPIGNESS